MPKANLTIQGESREHKVSVFFKSREAFGVLENRTPDNDYIEILEVSGDLPADFNEYIEEYENELIEQL
jgi:hypothetical protein